MKLDHIAIAGTTLAEAVEWVESRLDVPLQPGGVHEVFGTHNQLLRLEDGFYLEAIAIDPAAPSLAYPRWFDLDRFSGSPRLTNWICQVPDLDEILQHLPQAGDPVQLSRGGLRWRMAVPKNGQLPYDSCFPALIEWQSPAHPGVLLTRQGCRLEKLTISHPQAKALESELASYLETGVLRFETGPVALRADIRTPNGVRQL